MSEATLILESTFYTTPSLVAVATSKRLRKVSFSPSSTAGSSSPHKIKEPAAHQPVTFLLLRGA
jgi:hypothetical protein